MSSCSPTAHVSAPPMPAANPLTTLAVLAIMPTACVDTQLLPNDQHCAQQSGDAWCTALYPDASRPFCLRGRCESPDPRDPHPFDGCISERPNDDACYSPCGGTSSLLEDSSCLPPDGTTDVSTATGLDPATSTGLDPQPSCGDAVIDPDELCDDGEHNGDAGHCALGCQGFTSGCGDALAQDGEACDDGNPVEGDGCNPDCRASGAVVWQRELVFGGVLRSIVIAPDGAAYVAGGISDAPSRAWAARLDDHQGTIDWAHTVEPPASSLLPEVFLVAHSISEGLIAFAGRHGDLAYVVVLDEAGSFLEEAFDPAAGHIDGIADIGNGYLAKRGDLAVRYDYALSEVWTVPVGVGLAYRRDDDVALAAPLDGASFRRFGLDGVPFAAVNFPLPAGVMVQSQLVTWTPDGDVVVAGLASNAAAQDAFVLRSSVAGDLRWLSGIDTLHEQARYPACLAVDGQGAVVVGGYAWLLGTPRPFLVKRSAEGDVLWTRTLELTSSNGFISGCTTNAANEVVVVGQADGHMWLAKVTP